MNVTIVSIGKGKPGAEAQLYQEYVKRLPWKVTLIEKKEHSEYSGDKKKAAEGRLLLEAGEKAERRIALDEKGRQLSSEAFAAHIGKWKDEGIRDIAFFIGGSDGLSEEVRKASHLVLSLGLLTWPHFMVRALLAEQLYRAHSILSNHPYHRS